MSFLVSSVLRHLLLHSDCLVLITLYSVVPLYLTDCLLVRMRSTYDVIHLPYYAVSKKLPLLVGRAGSVLDVEFFWETDRFPLCVPASFQRTSIRLLVELSNFKWSLI